MTKLTAAQIAVVQTALNQLKKQLGCDLIVLALHRDQNMEYFRVSNGGAADFAARQLLHRMSEGVTALNNNPTSNG